MANPEKTESQDVLNDLGDVKKLDKKLQNLVNQINEITQDKDQSNDSIDGVFDKKDKLSQTLDKGLSKALKKCDISTINVFINAVDNVLKQIESGTLIVFEDVKQSLGRLEGGLKSLKEGRETKSVNMFNTVNTWVKGLLNGNYTEDPHRNNEDRNALDDYIKNDSNRAEVLNLYYQISNGNDKPVKIDYGKLSKNSLDNIRKIGEMIKSVYAPKDSNGSILNEVNSRPEIIKETKLNEVFRDDRADNLAKLAKDYLKVDWDGNNLDSDLVNDIISKHGGRDANLMFTQEDFVSKFNEVNEERRKMNEEKIKGINIDSEMEKFSRNGEGNLLYVDQLFDISKMQEVFKDLVDGIFRDGNFLKDEGLDAIFSKISELAMAGVEKREDEEYIDLGTNLYDVKPEDFQKISEILGNDAMFLKCLDNNPKHGSYNLKKLNNYLSSVVNQGNNRDTILNLQKDKNKGIYEFKALIIAVQILLNKSEITNNKTNLLIDGKYGGKTINRIYDFQRAYNKEKESRILIEDGKPGIQTITALLNGEGEVKDPKTLRYESLCKKTSLTVDEAKRVVEFANKNSNDLILNLKIIDKDVAEELAKNQGDLCLDGLTGIDKGVAEKLAEHQGYLSLDGLTGIDKGVAEELAKHKGDLSLDGLTEIDKDLAAELAKHQGDLYLKGLTGIDKGVAEKLAEHQGSLYLKGLTGIDKGVAEELVKLKGYLSLDGLTEIDKDLAAELAKHQGYLSLDGLTGIDKGVAEKLAEHQGYLSLNGLTGIDKGVAEELAKHKGDLSLDGLTEIDKGVAEELAKHKGALYLNKLTGIDKGVAEELAEHQGSLYLNGLTGIDKDVAEELAKHKGDLSLDGLTEIDKGVAAELAKHEGILSLNGLENIKDDVATELAKAKNLIKY